MRRPHSSRQALSVLAALHDRPQAWRHGYDLMGETNLKSGTLYPLLMRLADDGLLESEWQEPVPPARAFAEAALAREQRRPEKRNVGFVQ